MCAGPLKRLHNTWKNKKNGTHEDEKTVPYKNKSLDGTKPNTNPKTNPNHNTNPNTNHIPLFYAFFEHRTLIFNLAAYFCCIFMVSLHFYCFHVLCEFCE